MSIKVLEAFAGIGAQRKALTNVGLDYESVGIIEIDKPAENSYNLLHGQTKNFGDITKVDEKELPDFDLFTYSFPCTQISNVGSRTGLAKGSNTSSSLLWECERIIREKKPKYLLMENVPALLNKKFKPYWLEWVSILDSLGYKTFYDVLDARDFNIPQARKRVFGVSILGDENFTFPTGEKLTTFFDSFLDDRDDYKYIDTLRWGNELAKQKNQITENLKRAYHSKELVELGNYRGYKEKGSSFRSTVYSQFFSQYGVTRTLTTKGDICFLTDDNRVREITPRECVRLMGFTDQDYLKMSAVDSFGKRIVSDRQIRIQCGNSIVVQVLEAIFKEMFKDYL